MKSNHEITRASVFEICVYFNIFTLFMLQLPTQFYMALLYTITTVILTGQTIYYSHIYHHLKAKKSRATSKPQKHQRGDTSLLEKLLGAKDGGVSRNNNQSNATIPIPSSPIPVNTKFAEQYHTPSSPTSDYYYMSARSLSRSPVPTAGTWLGNSRQSSRTPPQMNGQSEPLIGEITTAQSASPTRTKNTLSVVPWLGLLFSMCLLHLLVGSTHREVPSGTVIPVGRRLLLFNDDQGHSSLSHGNGSEIGSFLGWAMAIIYMGGRLPQIFLNMQRGHVEASLIHLLYSPICCSCRRYLIPPPFLMLFVILSISLTLHVVEITKKTYKSSK
jgi:hypothetical protein